MVRFRVFRVFRGSLLVAAERKLGCAGIFVAEMLFFPRNGHDHERKNQQEITEKTENSSSPLFSLFAPVEALFSRLVFLARLYYLGTIAGRAGALRPRSSCVLCVFAPLRDNFLHSLLGCG
jgi:hypothetical protein